MVDCWKQSAWHFPKDDLKSRMAWTWGRASFAMMTTTASTAAAFFANLISPIAPVAVFGVFSGLLVVVNYLLVISWFPAVIIMKEKKLGPYYVIAYCGCCLWGLPLSWFCWKQDNEAAISIDDEVKEQTSENPAYSKPDVQVVDSEDTAATPRAPTEDVEDDVERMMGTVEKFFHHTFAPLLYKAKLPLVIGWFVFFVISIIVAAQLQPAEDAAAFLPAADPMQRAIDLGATEGVKVFDSTSQQQFVNIYFGVSDIDRDNVDFLNAGDYGVVEWDSKFPAAIATKEAQEGVIWICEQLRSTTRPLQKFVQRVYTPGGEVLCPMEGFRDWVEDIRNETVSNHVAPNAVATFPQS